MRIETPLVGERIVIRSYTAADLAFVTDMWFDPENGRFMSDPDRAHVDETFQKALDGMEDSSDGYYFVVELRGGERIGTCCAFPEDGVYDIGYCIHKSRWKQGFGTELVELLVSWIRERGGTAVTAEAAKENQGSCALLEKCGFVPVKDASFAKYHMDVRFESLIYEKKLQA